MWTLWCSFIVLAKRMASTSATKEPPVSDEEKEKRNRLCEEFIGVAGVERPVARTYLSSHDWDMEVEHQQCLSPVLYDRPV